MPVKKREISLLPAEEDVYSFSARALRWATVTGRYIIVLTEFIVILAFLSRFILDRQNADLSEVIRQQKAILQSTQDFEKEYDLLQKRMAFVKNYYDQPQNYIESINSLIESTPLDIIYKSILIKKDDQGQIFTTISILTQNEDSVKNFMGNLSANSNIDSVNVKSIVKKPKESFYSVDVDLTFKNSSKNAQS